MISINEVQDEVMPNSMISTIGWTGTNFLLI